MADFKYIMFEANGQMLPVIFPDTVIHEDMASGISHAVRRTVINQAPHHWASRPVSAGFISGLICTATHGVSDSLRGLKAREEDRAIINTWPYNMGREGLPGIEEMVIEAVRRGLSE